MCYVFLRQKTVAPCDMRIDAVLCPFSVDNSINRKNIRLISQTIINRQHSFILKRCHYIMVWCHSVVMSFLWCHYDVISLLCEIIVLWCYYYMISLCYDCITVWCPCAVMSPLCDVMVLCCQYCVMSLCFCVISLLCDVIILWCHYGWMSSYNFLTCKTVDFAVASVFDGLNDVGDVV